MRSGGDSLSMKPSLVTLAVSLVLMGTLAQAAAQGQYVRLDGRVQWIAAEKMMFLPDSGGTPVTIDLTRVPQHEYATLTQGSLVVVNGVVSYDGRRVIATSVMPLGGLGEQAP